MVPKLKRLVSFTHRNVRLCLDSKDGLELHGGIVRLFRFFSEVKDFWLINPAWTVLFL